MTLVDDESIENLQANIDEKYYSIDCYVFELEDCERDDETWEWSRLLEWEQRLLQFLKSEKYQSHLHPINEFWLANSIKSWRYHYYQGILSEIYNGTLLHLAARLNLIHLAEYVLSQGLDPNRKNHYEHTALIEACMNWNNQSFIELLLTYNADPNIPTKAGDYPLHVSSDIETLKLLIAKGARVDAVNENGRSALWRACDQCEIEKIIFLLELGAQLPCTEEGRSIIFDVSMKGYNKEVVNLLLDFQFGKYISEKQKI